MIGQAVYENAFAGKAAHLRTILTPSQADQVLGGNAGAATQYIDSLPPLQKTAVREAFAKSLQPMWIMYTAFSGIGCIAMLFIKRKQLTRQHEETKTGLEAEKANAALRAAEREARRAPKA